MKFLREHAVEPNTKMTHAQLLNSHVYPFIGKRRVAEIGRETIHRLLTVVLPEEGASQKHLLGKGSNNPAHAHQRWSQAVLRTFNTHNKCTGVCRSVGGIPVGIGRRVADLWGFCGACRSPPTCLAGPTRGTQALLLLDGDDHSPSNLALPDRPSRQR